MYEGEGEGEGGCMWCLAALSSLFQADGVGLGWPPGHGGLELPSAATAAHRLGALPDGRLPRRPGGPVGPAHPTPSGRAVGG